MNVLIIAPHPDDEVLGMGGTIKKLSKKNNIILCVVSEGVTAQYSGKNAVEERKKFCQECSSILGISKIFFLDFPDNFPIFSSSWGPSGTSDVQM